MCGGDGWAIQMKQRCQACGVEKDTQANEIYPYPDDGIIYEPINPLMTIDCQGADEWRVVTVCHDCFHKLSPDMWIHEISWQSLNPRIPFHELPRLA